MRFAAVFAAAAALGLASAFLVACGDRNNLIPGTDAGAINSALSKASSDFAAQECQRSFADVALAQRRASSLPGTVDAGLRRNVEENIISVDRRVHAQCGNGQPTTPTTSTATTATTATTPTTTETTPPTTTTEPTPPPTTTATTPEPPAGNGNSGGTPPGQVGKGARFDRHHKANGLKRGVD